MTRLAERPKPFVVPEYCKGCGRCIGSCVRGCFSLGDETNPTTGLVPIALDLADCNGCALCIDACPEPYGLQLEGDERAVLGPAVSLSAGTERALPGPEL
ncbi:MAG: DUF362 domain-containing protein, partial [Desulfobaccales bacterium]